MNDEHEEWRLVLVPVPSWGADHVLRMRRLLKLFWRSFGFRCVRVELVKVKKEGPKAAPESQE